VKDTVKVWALLSQMHDTFICHNNTPERIAAYKQTCAEFKKAFVEHPSSAGGYGRTNFTPYMHIVCDHFPNILARLKNGDIRNFSGEATESICRLARNVHRHSAHRNSCRDVIVKKMVLEMLLAWRYRARKYSNRARTVRDRPELLGPNASVTATAVLTNESLGDGDLLQADAAAHLVAAFQEAVGAREDNDDAQATTSVADAKSQLMAVDL
jgi:hypothetical protein